MQFEKQIFSNYTEREQAYAVSQLDPFHDTPYRLEGAPSDANCDSVVMVVNQEKVISASDFGLSTGVGDKWDFHVALLPILQRATFYSARLAQSTQLITGGSSDESPFTTLYPLTVSAVASGDPTFIYDTGLPNFVGIDNKLAGYFPSPTSTIQVPRVMRVIGVSFEVVDETPKYYQQGSCTVYMKQSTIQDSVRLGTAYTPDGLTANIQRNSLFELVGGPPNDLEQTTILPNSKTWKASEGAYVVGRRTDSDNQFRRSFTNNMVIYNPNYPANPLLKNSYIPREALNGIYDQGDSQWYDSFNQVIPYNVSGAYFSGVSSQYGTYRIRTKFMYEILPDPTDVTLIPLATPTIPRNPNFEYALNDLLKNLPIGVQQSMNPKGEFWGMILKATKKTAKVARNIANNGTVRDLVGTLPFGDTALNAISSAATAAEIVSTLGLKLTAGQKKAMSKMDEANKKAYVSNLARTKKAMRER